MDSLRAGLESRGPSRIRLSASTKNLTRVKRKRPIISEPIGPIKNSRGPDFARSETFKIVPRIKDCIPDEPPASGEDSIARKTTRRLSASFLTQGPLASPPTVAKSNLNITTTSQVPTKKKKATPIISSLRSASKSALKTTSSFNVFPSFETVVQDENVPPPDHEIVNPSATASKPLNKSRLPKSRTLTVLSDIKSSISRSSLNSRTANFRSMGSQSRQASASSSNTNFQSNSSRIRLPRPSLTSMSRSSSSSTTGTQSQPDPQQITTAQPSAYWSGRFVALNDRFLSEEFDKMVDTPVSPPFMRPFQRQTIAPDRVAANARPTHLSHSTTTSALTSLTSSRRVSSGSDEDARYIRIFRHLNDLCTTNEARRSLHDWQQTYARRMGKPNLLPKGGRMDDKSLMSKLFGGGPHKTERRSLPAVREGTSVPVARTRPVPAARGRGKRLTIN
ncbi:hypothetical protein FALBO_8682 [Fusarium albosuccineum]|uniref:Uncharacterized protein n=1 Tax=Fusarium albosuccineum TaxID=1237068 RepID=A0A8H4PJB9_9HYPO|nr:hypothetical protein FALBO_8682 [Fusarium albosuccineum]